MKGRKLKKCIISLQITILVVSLALFFMLVAGVDVRAESGVDNKFDKTNVMDDLNSAELGGKPFNVVDYPYRPLSDESVQVITFVEYCYSARQNMQQNFGMYIYLYNPKAIDFDVNNPQNRIQMGVETKVEDGQTKVNSYEKFELQFCSASEGNYKDLFLKFKVVDREINGKTFLDRLNSNNRRYDVSGIEIVPVGQTLATEFRVGGTYQFQGYSTGYGIDLTEKSTLSCSVIDLETVEIEPKSTYYRNSSQKGKGYQNNLSTVYFDIPNRFINDYGNLQKIKAEWYEYKTKPMLATTNKALHDDIVLNAGKNASNSKWSFAAFSSRFDGPNWVDLNFDKRYNCSNDGLLFSADKTINNVSSKTENIDKMYSSFLIKGYNSIVTSKEIKSHFESYDKSEETGKVQYKNISADLFLNGVVDEGRKFGYNNCVFDAGDLINILGYDTNHNWWQKFLEYGFWAPKTDDGFQNVEPIYKLSNSDFAGDEQAKSMLVNDNDFKDVKKTYDEKNKDNTMFLFRFAVSDYWTLPVVEWNSTRDRWTTVNSWLFQETVFLGFDILEFTFSKEGVKTIIPVVMSPIDIVADATAPPEADNEFWDWLKKIFATIVGVLIIVLIIFLCVTIAPIGAFILALLSVVLKVILLPFKLIGAMMKGLAQKDGGKSE